MIRTIIRTSCGRLWRPAQSRFFIFLSRLARSTSKFPYFLAGFALYSFFFSFVNAESSHFFENLLRGTASLPNQVLPLGLICMALGNFFLLVIIFWGLAVLSLAGLKNLFYPRASTEIVPFFTEWSQKIDTQIRIQNEVEQLKAITHHDPVKKSTQRRL